VKKSKVGVSSWFFLTHPFIPSLAERGDNSLLALRFPLSCKERGSGGEFKKMPKDRTKKDFFTGL
jgi:hypothetical protein